MRDDTSFALRDAVALATLFLPLITVPLYLVVLFVLKRHERTEKGISRWQAGVHFMLEKLDYYYTSGLRNVGAVYDWHYLYSDHQSIDARLARATQAS